MFYNYFIYLFKDAEKGYFELFDKQNLQDLLCKKEVIFKDDAYSMVRVEKSDLKNTCGGNDKIESMKICGLYANTDIRLYDHDTPPTTADESYTKSYLKVTVKKDMGSRCEDISSLEKKIDTEYVLAERPNGGDLNGKISSYAYFKGILVLCNKTLILNISDY